MLREISTTLAEILQGAIVRDTLDLYLSDGSVRRLSRGAVTRTIDGGTFTYSNWIKSVGEMKYSLTDSVDRVEVVCQNVNSILGFDVASNLRLLDYAHAKIGKFYQSSRNPTLVEDVPVEFIGTLSNAEVSEKEIKFEVIVDFDALGTVIGTRQLRPRCPWLYKDGINCHSTSPLATCPKNRAACVERGVEWEFGGWEFFEQPVSTPPGGGGDGGGGDDDFPPCFLGNVNVWTAKRQMPFADFYEAFHKSGFKQIFNFSEKTGKIYLDEAVDVFKHTTTGYFEFEFSDGAIVEVTPEHPFWSVGYSWKTADSLKLKDSVWRYINKKWKFVSLEAIKWNSRKTVEVYNLHALLNKNYFANNFGVHNRKRGDEEIFL